VVWLALTPVRGSVISRMRRDHLACRQNPSADGTAVARRRNHSHERPEHPARAEIREDSPRARAALLRCRRATIVDTPRTRGHLQVAGRSRGALLTQAIRTLLGTEAVPMIVRKCVVCDRPFEVARKAVRRQTCSSECERELKRRARLVNARVRASSLGASCRATFGHWHP